MAWLRLKALLLTVRLAPWELAMPPPMLPPKKVKLAPPRAWSPVKLEFAMTALPRLYRPPPNTSEPTLVIALLLLTSQRARVRLAPTSLRMPPPPAPPTLWLAVTAQSARVRLPALSMPPPAAAVPFVVVRLLIVTVFPALTAKTRLALLPLTVSRSWPRPSMVTLVVTASWPLVSLIVRPLRLLSKRIVSPLPAAPRSARSESGPLSLALSTT